MGSLGTFAHGVWKPGLPRPLEGGWYRSAEGTTAEPSSAALPSAAEFWMLLFWPDFQTETREVAPLKILCFRKRGNCGSIFPKLATFYLPWSTRSRVAIITPEELAGEGAGESRSPKQLLQAWAGIPRPIPLGLGREDRVYIQKFKVISTLTRDGWNIPRPSTFIHRPSEYQSRF